MAVQCDQAGTTVFTSVVVVQLVNQFPAIIISDELRHDKFALSAFSRAVLDHVLSSGIGVHKINFFSNDTGG